MRILRNLILSTAVLFTAFAVNGQGYFRFTPVLFGKVEPQFTTTPTATRLTTTAFAVQGTTDRASNVYAYVLADGAATPTSTVVKSSGTSALATSYFVIDFSGLTANTAYDVYVVAEDLSGNLQGSPYKLDVTTTIDLNTFFGSNLKLWVNSRALAGKTLQGTSNEVMTAMSTSETSSSTLTVTGASVGNNYMYYNGKSLVYYNACMSIASNKTKLKHVHTGAPWTIAFRMSQPKIANTSTVQAIINTNNASTGKTGFLVTYSNISPRAHSLIVTVTKSSAGNPNLSLTIDNFFNFGTTAMTTVVLKFDGTTLTCYKDGVSAGTATATNLPFSTADSSDDIFMGRLSTTATFINSMILIKDIVVTDVAISDPDRATLENFLGLSDDIGGTSAPKANLYELLGQSNMTGMEAGSPPNPPASTAIKTQIWHSANFSSTVTNYWGFWPLQFGSTPISSGTYGGEMGFGYNMAQWMPNMTFIVRHAEGGTPLKVWAGGDDWNAVTTGELLDNSTTNTIFAYRRAKYILDRNVTYRGIFWRQGETDALNDASTYETDFTALINKKITVLMANDIVTSKARMFVSLLDNAFTSPTRPFTNDVNTAFTNVKNSFSTANWRGINLFSTSALPLYDGTHFGATSGAAFAHGQLGAEAAKPYMNEQ